MMDAEPDQTSPTVLDLATKTYSARQVIEATGISDDMLTNYLTKEKISLCSQSPGRGRARAYCYVDVLQLKLLTSLVDLTGKAEWSARALEYVLFQEVVAHDLATVFEAMEADKYSSRTYQTNRAPNERIEQINHLRGQFCADIRRSPPIYWARSSWRHWFLFADRLNIGWGQYKLKTFRADDNHALSAAMRSGYLLNATTVLDEVDRKLSHRE